MILTIARFRFIEPKDFNSKTMRIITSPEVIVGIAARLERELSLYRKLVEAIPADLLKLDPKIVHYFEIARCALKEAANNTFTPTRTVLVEEIHARLCRSCSKLAPPYWENEKTGESTCESCATAANDALTGLA